MLKKNNLFISEAMWTRFMPSVSILDNILKSGIIGDISSLTADLGYRLNHIERLQKPELADGALLDLGVYTISFASIVLGKNITDIKSSCIKNEYGVDKSNSIIITFDGNKTAVLHSNATVNTNKKGVIYGSLGRIEVYDITNFQKIVVILEDNEIKEYAIPEQISGYEYEIYACIDAIKNNKLETKYMSHSETLRIMKIMDNILKEWNIEL